MRPCASLLPDTVESSPETGETDHATLTSFTTLPFVSAIRPEIVTLSRPFASAVCWLTLRPLTCAVALSAVNITEGALPATPVPALAVTFTSPAALVTSVTVATPLVSVSVLREANFAVVGVAVHFTFWALTGFPSSSTTVA
ncbi:hypothetical protein D3C78_1251190 [compost metagenome]